MSHKDDSNSEFSFQTAISKWYCGTVYSYSIKKVLPVSMFRTISGVTLYEADINPVCGV